METGSYWSKPTSELLLSLQSGESGLTSVLAGERLKVSGPNEIREQQVLSRAAILWRQVKSPLVLLLVFASGVSFLTSEWIDGGIVLSIILATTGIGYWREYSAQNAIAALQALVQTKVKVVRDGKKSSIPLSQVVPGDLFLLSAGSLVPADGVILESSNCFVSEAVLTGESFPVLKKAGSVESSAPLPKRFNCVFKGTNVRSGTALCLAAATGRSTEFGAIAHRLSLRPPDTEFDLGIKKFGNLLLSVMLVMVLIVFVAHLLNGRPTMETFLFAIALAVGLSPELLPAILSVNLSRGAREMASRGVLVRHLNAIENLGSMDVLCTDKTGTLTEGVVNLEGAFDERGVKSEQVLEWAAVNASLETGLENPLDDAILKAKTPDLSALRKMAEIPFDFTRKRVTVVVAEKEKHRMIIKGAFHHVLEVCETLNDGAVLGQAQRDLLEKRYNDWSEKGIRVVAVAVKEVARQELYDRSDEKGMAFAGFLTFLDSPKEGASLALAELKKLGVSVKIISGDSKPVAQYVAGLVGMDGVKILTGSEIDNLPDEALWREAERTDLFVEVDPNQKEKIILSLRKMGHVVGFMGDGVNDAPAMHSADTSLSVEGAVDVAREAADFVLLDKHLDVIRRGIEEGRKTFANTLKYVLTTTSANLGNMVSMAGASLFLPFLPMTAGQILLNNFLSDIPAFGLAGDNVDEDWTDKPRRWDIRFIGRFMVEFGILSSVFDFLTFGFLLALFHTAPGLFQTGWFVESVLTELVIALVVRTRKPFYRSRPGKALFLSTLILTPAVLLLPALPFSRVFGFVPLPTWLTLSLVGITALYVLSAEILKKWFYRRAA